MKVADLISGPARLDDAVKTLRLAWEGAKGQWHDPVSLQFEKNYLEIVERQVLGTLERMRSLAGAMSAAVHECEEEWR